MGKGENPCSMNGVKMVKVRLRVPPPYSHSYNTPRGHSYAFDNNPLEIKDEDDLSFFRSKSDVFMVEDFKEKVKETIKKILPKNTKIEKFTEKQLYDMNKDRQAQILRQYGVEDNDIPK